MGFAPEDVRVHIGSRVHKDVSSSTGDDYSDVTLWIVQAAKYLQRMNDWTCHKQEFSLTLTAGTYEYPYSSAVWSGAALVRPRKIQMDAIRQIDSSRRLTFVDEIEEVDRLLGSQWRDANTQDVVPRYATIRGNSLIVAGKPSASFISDYPTLEGYYYRGEALVTSAADWETTDFEFFDDFYMDVVDLAIIFGMQQEDETEFRTMLQQWNSNRLPELRGYDHTPSSDEQIATPGWYGSVEGESYIH